MHPQQLMFQQRMAVVPYSSSLHCRPAAAAPQAGGAADAELAVALIENSSRCPTNEEGEKVVPGEVPWIVDLVDKVGCRAGRM